jgi:hypothetical protein
MWHGVAHVTNDYDTILYESPEPSNVLVLNAGPGNVDAQAWSEVPPVPQPKPQIGNELRPGDQRMLGGSLIRAHLKSGNSAAVAWRLLSSGGSS